MLKYRPATEALRQNKPLMEVLLKFQASFRKLVAIVANHKAKQDVTAEGYTPSFLYKCEGGIRVAGYDIVMGSNAVYDDYGRSKNHTKQEEALVEALEEISTVVGAKPFDNPTEDLMRFRLSEFTDHWFVKNKLTLEQRLNVLKKIEENNSPFGGDPLRNFFGVVWSSYVAKLNKEARTAGKDALYF